MKIGILTFQFAHNYGALVQAYALKEYLDEQGFESSIINYVPDKVRKEYSMNPFGYSHNLKVVLSLSLRNIKRFKQNVLFTDFQKNELNLGDSIYSTETLHSNLSSFDIVSVGSDQVWNTNITGDISSYFFGSNKTVKMISYAASFGTRTINKFQEKTIVDRLPQFSMISVREEQGVEILKQYGLNADLVCDPVFLLPKHKWSEFENRPKSIKYDKKFVLLYGLSGNINLERCAFEHATNEDIDLYVIHPTAQRISKVGKQLFDVGPREFIWLIHHADRIYSNSFHATAFSVIFEKKLVYDSVKGLESRVFSLFKMLGVNLRNGVQEYDLSIITDGKLESYIQTGKEFLSKIRE